MKKIQRKSHRFRSYEIDKKFICHALIVDALYLMVECYGNQDIK